MVSVEDGYHLLSGLSNHIYLIGLSMGGVLTLLMSTKLDVTGVVVMSTPYRLPTNVPAWLMQAISFFIPYRTKTKVDTSETWFDQSAYVEHISYPKNPVRSAAELQRLTQEMRAALPKVTAPVLLMHSKNDEYVLPESMEHIYTDLGASNKTKFWLTESGHIIPRDAERENAFRVAADFIHRIEASI